MFVVRGVDVDAVKIFDFITNNTIIVVIIVKDCGTSPINSVDNDYNGNFQCEDDYGDACGD